MNTRNDTPDRDGLVRICPCAVADRVQSVGEFAMSGGIWHQREGSVAEQVVPVEEQVEHVAERLVRDYAGQVPDQVVRTLVSEAYGPLRTARVTQFVPVLVDVSVRRRLRTAGRQSA